MNFLKLFAVVLACPSLAHGSVYCGVIGELPVIVEITKGGARYLYRKHNKVIDLKTVSSRKNEITLEEGSGKTASSFELSGNEDESECELAKGFSCRRLNGAWKSGSKEYEVALYESYGLASIDAYRKGIEKKEVTFGTTTVALIPNKVKTFGFKYRVTRFSDAKQIPAINKMLESLDQDETVEDGESACDDLFFARSQKFALLSENLLSIEDRLDGMAPGAAYPLNDEGSTHLIDLANKKVLGLEDVFSDFKKQRLAILKIVFAERIKEKKKMNTVPEDDEENSCLELFQPEFGDDFDSFDLYVDVKKKAVGLAPVYPHYANFCNQNPSYAKTDTILKYLSKGTSVYKAMAKSL